MLILFEQLVKKFFTFACAIGVGDDVETEVLEGVGYVGVKVLNWL